MAEREDTPGTGSGAGRKTFSAFPWWWILIYLAAVAALVCGGFLLMHYIRENAWRRSVDELAAVGELKKKQITEYIRERRSDAVVIRESPFLAENARSFLANPLPGKTEDELLVRMRSLMQSYGYREVFLLDAEGGAALSVPGGGEKVGPFTASLAREAMATGLVLLSDLHVEEEIGYIHLDLIAPIPGAAAGGMPSAGAFLLRIDPYSYLYPLIQSWPVPSASAETLLVRREGDEVVYLNELRHRQETALTLRASAGEERLPAAMAARGARGVVEGRDYRGAEVLAYIDYIPGLYWYLVTKKDKGEVYAGTGTRVWMALSLMVVMVLALGLLLAFAWSRRQGRFYRREYELERERSLLARRYELLSNQANDTIIITDREGRILEANQRAAEAYGYSREELIGMPASELRAPAVKEGFDDTLSRIDESGGLIYETEQRHRDGTVFPVEVSARVIEEGGEKFYLGVMRDISERRRMRDEAEASEARFRGLFENMSSGVAVYEAKGGGEDFIFKDINKAVERIEKVRREDVVGKSVMGAFPGVRDFGLFEVLQRVYRTGKPERFPATLYEDERISGWRENYVFRLPSGEVVAVYDDITERKQAEDEINRKSSVLEAINRVFREALGAESEAEVAAVCLRMAEGLTASAFGFLGEINERGRLDILAMSDLGWKQCRMPESDAVRLIRDMELRGFWGRAALSGEPQIVNDPASDPDRTGAPEGHPPITSFLGVPLRRGGDTVGMIALANREGGYTRRELEDVESLSVAFVEAMRVKRAESEIRLLNQELEKRVAERTAELEAANRELEAFSYSVSHDLRAPLRGIDGFSQALLEDYADKLDEQGKDFLNRVRAASQRMAVLIDEILALSRVSRGEMHRERVDLSAVAEEIAQDLRSSHPEREVEFVLQPGLAAEGDATLLRLVISNLLENAFKFTSKHRRARIEFGGMEKDGKKVYFVRDDGAGFDMAYAGKLFGVFQRLHKAEEFPGNGIGLATVQRIVRRPRGAGGAGGVGVKGGVFYFTLPG
jgi:PAS domain S-box-containing protein